MTKNIEYNELLEVSEDKGVIHLVINLKYIVKVVEAGFPFKNTPHSTNFVFCETNVRYYQYNTEAVVHHYL